VKFVNDPGTDQGVCSTAHLTLHLSGSLGPEEPLPSGTAPPGGRMPPPERKESPRRRGGGSRRPDAPDAALGCQGARIPGRVGDN
jgi:hypothetical protein